MSNYSRVRRNSKNFSRLTGVRVEEFEDLFIQIFIPYEEWNKKRLKNRKRKREI
jgi:hypothetical protein